MSAFQRFLLMRAQDLLRQPRRLTMNPLFQLLPVNRRLLEIKQVQTGDRRILILDRLCCVRSPVIVVEIHRR
jgi:hypothetical protein